MITFCIVVALASTAFADLVPTYAVPVAPVLPVATSTVHHTPAEYKATRVTSYETVQQGVPHTLAKVLCLLAALLGNAMAVYVPTYGLPVAGYPTVPAVSTIHAAPVAALQTVHHAVPVTPHCSQRAYPVRLPHNRR
ncbi:hypothetical protein MTO96_019719 [Rhipicephalus appendiculatus]